MELILYNLKTILVVLLILVFSIIATSYTISTPEYNDWKRYFLLYLSYIILIYNFYYLSIKLFLLNNSTISLREGWLSILFNLISCILAYIIISYTNTCEQCLDTEDYDWKRWIILSFSIIIFFIILSIIILGFTRHGRKLGIKVKLTPEKIQGLGI